MKIKFRILSQEYVQSCIECVYQSNITQDPITIALQLPKEVEYQNTVEEISDSRHFSVTIIAVDIENNNKVMGCFPGVDLVNFEDPKLHPSSNRRCQQYREFEWNLIKPLKEKYKEPGQVLLGSNFAVREEVANRGLGQRLLYEFMQNAIRLGYKLSAAPFYNDASRFMMLKYGGQIITHVDLKEVLIDGQTIFQNIKNGCDLIQGNIEDFFKNLNKFKVNPKL